MVYGFAGRSGGSARIYSEVGKGTMICLYVQRRLAPWIGAIMWILAFSGVVVAPASRAAIGWATADILSLLLDLAAAVVSLLMIVRHWRTVRSLIVKRGRRWTLGLRSRWRPQTGRAKTVPAPPGSSRHCSRFCEISPSSY